MRSVLVALAALAVLCAPARANDARIISEKQVEGRILELMIETPAFVAPTGVHVDLPVGYDAQPKRRWPVTYYVAGTNHRYPDFNDSYSGEQLTREFESIIVSPNGNSGYWSDWYNGGAFGPPQYETYVIEQLIPLIDSRFRTTARRSGRAIFGESMGGYGAMMLAARHPDVFVAASSLSGAVDSNLPANGAVLSASSSLDGAAPDAIYGPRSTEEIRWHGHNPTDLADNLRNVDLQVGSANGTSAPEIGEGPSDVPGCAVEIAVHMASINLHDSLDQLEIPHAYRDYGPGCHSVPNFERQITDSVRIFGRVFEHPRPAPAKFDYKSIEPEFEVWGWRVQADPARPLEFLQLRDAGRRGVKLEGSGLTTVTTPRLFRGARRVVVKGASTSRVARGRVTFTADLPAVITFKGRRNVS